HFECAQHGRSPAGESPVEKSASLRQTEKSRRTRDETASATLHGFAAHSEASRSGERAERAIRTSSAASLERAPAGSAFGLGSELLGQQVGFEVASGGAAQSQFCECSELLQPGRRVGRGPHQGGGTRGARGRGGVAAGGVGR